MERPQAWEALQRDLKNLTDELESYSEDLEEAAETLSPAALRGAHEATWEFSNRVFHALCCTCFQNPERRTRLRLATGKNKKSHAGIEQYCILLTQDNSLLKWHELLIQESEDQSQLR